MLDCPALHAGRTRAADRGSGDLRVVSGFKEMPLGARRTPPSASPTAAASATAPSPSSSKARLRTLTARKPKATAPPAASLNGSRRRADLVVGGRPVEEAEAGRDSRFVSRRVAVPVEHAARIAGVRGRRQGDVPGAAPAASGRSAPAGAGLRLCQVSVDIEVEFRQGNKRNFLTRVRGMEEYRIDGTVLARDVSHRFACRAPSRTGLGGAEEGAGGNASRPPEQGDRGSALLIGRRGMHPQWDEGQGVQSAE
ncbi:hypothetical protein THAOC_09050 [Thalassiosira oceanica]|uniref:SUI1 domain-containing protein n=1 Tax=Thalassiosira oceanica TaxID=159749 RepID=K0TGT8_THAOC|nr:hypothetical protein THAOC_09050 [Thalassiosira oceanica]|eukprot:EJK69667.1 hypothetical protein THAOC_09050 [Thalassiosira oceanica]